MRRIVIGNWKMNLGPSEAGMLVHRLKEHVKPHPDVDVVICPPFIDLFPLAKDLDHSKLKLGAQNLHFMDKGAYTGEISGEMLHGLVDYVLVGHSERRAMGEDDKLIAKKVAAAIRNDLTPVLCVGETLTDRQHGLSTKVTIDQLTADLHDVTAEDISGMIIAYEPVWAIGTGTPATPDQIKPCIRAIRATIEDLYGEQAASARVIYGASVAPEFVKSILSIPGVEGLLPGGASLNYAEFADIIQAAQAAA